MSRRTNESLLDQAWPADYVRPSDCDLDGIDGAIGDDSSHLPMTPRQFVCECIAVPALFFAAIGLAIAAAAMFGG